MNAAAELQCPHCLGGVPWRARVCRGCGSEAEYGAPQEILILVVLLSGFAGWKVGGYLNSVMGWVAFAILAVGGLVVCARLFRHSVRFKRVYKTK